MMTPLSASRISVLQTCSYLYFCKYNLNIPDEVNSGALRGTVLHLIFELFTRPERIKERKKQHKQMLDKQVLTKAVEKLVWKKLAELEKSTGVELVNEDNYELISKMILVGFSLDFYGKRGYKPTEPEIRFDIENNNPPYRIKGFIDQAYINNVSKTVQIRDWKSSKQKYGKDDRDGNLQWLMYDLAARKIWPKCKKRLFEFVFPKFNRSPIVEMPQVGDLQSRGFELFLADIQKRIDSMNEKLAKQDMAAYDQSRQKNCQFYFGRPCPAKDPFTYYVLKDKDGRVVQTEKEIQKLNFKDGLECEIRKYNGCPAFYS